MNEYVGAFLEGCQDDPERQLALVVAFTSITNQGLPVVPTFWRVVQFLSPTAVKGYVAWLRTHTSLLLLDVSWWLGRSGTQLCLAQGDKPVPVCHTTGYSAECDSLLEGCDGGS